MQIRSIFVSIHFNIGAQKILRNEEALFIIDAYQKREYIISAEEASFTGKLDVTAAVRYTQKYIYTCAHARKYDDIQWRWSDATIAQYLMGPSCEPLLFRATIVVPPLGYDVNNPWALLRRVSHYGVELTRPWIFWKSYRSWDRTLIAAIESSGDIFNSHSFRYFSKEII